MESTTKSGPAVVVDADALERVGVALADGTRRRMLLALLEGPIFPAELADRLGLTRGNVSNHLACLRGCGLVTATPDGRRVRYQLADPRLAHALADLASLVLVVAHGNATVCADDTDCCPPTGQETAQAMGAPPSPRGRS
jgi:DNA-binding transcriptional ArsR family regulator